MSKLLSAILCATFATSVLAITAAPPQPGVNVPAAPVATVSKTEQATPVQTSSTTTKNDERKNDRK